MGWQWHQLDHMQTICTSLQADILTTQFLGWWRSPAVEHRSLAGVLSLSCALLVADG